MDRLEAAFDKAHMAADFLEESLDSTSDPGLLREAHESIDEAVKSFTSGVNKTINDSKARKDG